MTPGAVRTAWIWLFEALAMTTSMPVNSPVFLIPAAETAWRAAVIDVPWTRTVVLPVRPES